MSIFKISFYWIVFVGVGIISLFSNSEAPTVDKEKPLHVLVTTQTKDYRHDSIPTAIKAFAEMAQERNWVLTFTEDPTFFHTPILADMDGIVFLMTSGDIFTETQQKEIEAFVSKGGGLFAVHSGGGCTEYDWPWFRSRMGAKFVSHPPVCEVELIIEDHEHPATEHYDTDRVLCEDEIYSFDQNPREHVNVLISADEESYDVNDNPWFKEVTTHSMGGDHPLVWYQTWMDGRVMHTALGHTNEQYLDPNFRKHLIGGLEWACKRR